MKKIISAILAICIVFALTGCSKKASASYELVMLTDGASISDGAYNQSAWDGVKAYAEENNINCRYYQPSLDENGELSTDTVLNYIDLAVKNGANTIVLPGEAFATSAYEIAPTYNDVNFILVDALPHSQDSNIPMLQSNVMCISFNSLQAGFLAGYTSVTDGYTKLGYFGSVKSKNSGDYGAGFAQGAAYAADEKGIPVTLDYADYDSPWLDYSYSFTIKPVYVPIKDAKKKTFKVTVVDGIGTGVYSDGENVTISANPAAEGKTFDHWDVKSDTEGVKDGKVNISHKNRPTMNLLVGSCDCTITAVWKDEKTVPITVIKPNYDVNKSLVEPINYYVPQNSQFSVKAPAAPSGFSFVKWECAAEGVVEDEKSSETNIKVGEEAIQLIPLYDYAENPTFDVTVENGTGSGSYKQGDKIEIVANPPKDGYMFYKWENVDEQGLATGIAMENEYCYKTEFEMVDRFASIVENMYDSGVQVVFAGGNSMSDSVFTATQNFDYPVYAFGYGIDEGSKGNCLASVVNDYGAAIKLALADFKGGNILSGSVKNGCIYVTGKRLDDATSDYAKIYDSLKNGRIELINVQSGADVRKSVNSKCLTLNYKIKGGS